MVDLRRLCRRGLRGQAKKPLGNDRLHLAGVLRSTCHALLYFPADQMKGFMPRMAVSDEGRKRLRGGAKALRKVVLNDDVENRMMADMAAHPFRRVEVHGQAHALLLWHAEPDRG